MNFRTDLALERRELLGGDTPDGVKSRTSYEQNAVITAIDITNEAGAKSIGKPVGRYVTVEVPPFSQDAELLDGRLTAITNELRRLLPESGLVLVAGLGNGNITPDALGPLTADRIFATRHISGELAQSLGFEDLRPVAGVAPGVLGQTGIETGEIISGLVKILKPCAVVTVDALASRKLSRLGCTVQLSDTGIAPGSGVGNARLPIDEKTVGVPVIAVGVPTVVDAATLAVDLTQDMDGAPDEETLRQAVEPRGASMMVTPREIDLLVERAARLVSLGINCALQPSVSPEDMLSLLQ